MGVVGLRGSMIPMFRRTFPSAPQAPNFPTSGFLTRHHRIHKSPETQRNYNDRTTNCDPTYKITLPSKPTIAHRSKMSFFGMGGRPQISSEQKIAQAEAEIDMVSDMYSRYVYYLHSDCLTRVTACFISFISLLSQYTDYSPDY